MICFLACFAELDAQTFKKNHFKGTNWFCDNTDSLFYKADTISLYRRMNLKEYEGAKYYEEDEWELTSARFVNMVFKKRSRLLYWERMGSMGLTFSGSFKWKFYSKRQELWLLRDERVFLKMKPLAQESFSIVSRFGDYEVPTIKWTFVRIK